MDNKWLTVPMILIFVCIIFTVVQGVRLNGPESTTEHHNVVSVMDDGRYLMETPDRELYLLDYHFQDMGPGDVIVIQSKTDGKLLASFLYVLLGIASTISLLILLALASDDRK